MFSKGAADVLNWLGTLLVVGSYLALAGGWISLMAYYAFGIVSAVCIGAACWKLKVYAQVALNVVWFFISLYGVWYGLK